MRRVDLNCDVGEGAGNDAALMPFITSANIACGVHAGDEATMRETVALARQHGVAVGAHPSLDDRENFGRLERPVTPEEVYQLVLTQTRSLQLHTRYAGLRLHHVKPHGALYNMAARNTLLADAVAHAVYEVDPRLILYGRANSALIAAAHRSGLAAAQEAFADRAYEPDGSLASRHLPGAVLPSAEAAVAQAVLMVSEGRVRALGGDFVAISVDTICLHGDDPHALELARQLRGALDGQGICVAPHEA